MVRVFITVDTELFPFTKEWREHSLSAEFRRDILGETSRGAFGLPYQLDRLAAYGLKAVFFVEALFASAVGPELLRRIVAMVQDAGQEVQLHVHAEWLQWMQAPFVPPRPGDHIRTYNRAEQVEIISRALSNLRAAGAKDVCAYRAGNYGANLDTLQALAQNGLRWDTSYNAMYLGSACSLRTDKPMLHAGPLGGVNELPISCFYQFGRHARHAQLCAISSVEMERALEHAHVAGWPSFVIVSHSFELLSGRRRGAEVAPDEVVLRRFDELCAFLDSRRDRFTTSGFVGLAAADVESPGGPFHGAPLQMPVPLTTVRYAEQLYRALQNR
jgi:hypothetical protein